MRVHVCVRTRSSREEVVKLSVGSYRVYMHEPALEGKANKKLVKMFAEYFRTKKNKVRIVQGLKNKDKIVEWGK